MVYSQRDLRAARMLAVILLGTGVLCAMPVVIALIDSTAGAARKTPSHGGMALAPLAVGALVAGFALRRKVEQLLVTGGREPEDEHGAAD